MCETYVWDHHHDHFFIVLTSGNRIAIAMRGCALRSAIQYNTLWCHGHLKTSDECQRNECRESNDILPVLWSRSRSRSRSRSESAVLAGIGVVVGVDKIILAGVGVGVDEIWPTPTIVSNNFQVLNLWNCCFSRWSNYHVQTVREIGPWVISLSSHAYRVR